MTQLVPDPAGNGLQACSECVVFLHDLPARYRFEPYPATGELEEYEIRGEPGQYEWRDVNAAASRLPNDGWTRVPEKFSCVTCKVGAGRPTDHHPPSQLVVFDAATGQITDP